MMLRRRFIQVLGRGSVSVVALGLAACSDDTSSPTTGSAPSSSTTPTTSPITTSTPPETSTSSPAGSGTAGWERVALGSVSAYIIVRSGEAAVVDTGVGGSSGAIAGVLESAGVGWSDVSTVVATHSHPDHVGSLGAVMEAAGDATAYAGAPDIPAISSPREIVAVDDGDIVFGLRVIATPGHTPGHVSLLDDDLGVLFAGDSLVGADGGVGGPVPRFTSDLDQAVASVAKMAELTFDDVVFGHGEPVLGGASDAVRALAQEL